ncbi:hypothetical protein VNO77_27548 [Canavalia gladiata]|uniref:Uncharacterized protein n=1 Tax=Canavalia gladiata TaxID=3824 RepID=A0AAN9KX53_CANGL
MWGSNAGSGGPSDAVSTTRPVHWLGFLKPCFSLVLSHPMHIDKFRTSTLLPQEQLISSLPADLSQRLRATLRPLTESKVQRGKHRTESIIWTNLGFGAICHCSPESLWYLQARPVPYSNREAILDGQQCELPDLRTDQH